MKVYLDSSAWVKRYLEEKGSPEVDLVFEGATAGRTKIVASFWNVGECIGVFDKRMERGELKASEFKEVLENFFNEAMDLAERGGLELVPVSAELLLGCWRLVLEEHVYQADALQLKTSLAEKCDAFLTGDKELVQIAEGHKINALNIEKIEDQKKLRKLLKADR